MSRLSPLAACLALALASGGCGSEEGGGGGPPVELPEGAIISMRDNEFVPRDAVVRVGQAVRWVNEGKDQHNAVAEEGDGPDSELFNSGGSYTWTPRKAGTVAYVCTVHPGMEGTVRAR